MSTQTSSKKRTDKNIFGPYVRQGNFLKEISNQFALFLKLVKDDRVPLVTKLIPLAAFLYFLFPLDLIADFFPGLGQLDDIGVLLIAFRLFFEFSPSEVVQEHLQGILDALKIGDRWSVPSADEGKESDDDSEK